MKTNPVHALLGGMALLAGRASVAQEASEPGRVAATEYEVVVTDNAERKRFDIRVVSRSDRRLCIANEEWPDDAGRLTVATDETYVQTSHGRVEAKPALLSAYCPGGCGVKAIEPRATLEGFVSYDAFVDAAAIATHDGRVLHMPINVQVCR